MLAGLFTHQPPSLGGGVITNTIENSGDISVNGLFSRSRRKHRLRLIANAQAAAAASAKAGRHSAVPTTPVPSPPPAPAPLPAPRPVSLPPPPPPPPPKIDLAPPQKSISLTRPNGSTVTLDLNTARDLALKEINKERAAIGLDPVSLDPTLTSIAQMRSDDMVKNDYLSHYDPKNPEKLAYMGKLDKNNNILNSHLY